jgi:shikimate dehydrogenase
MSEAPPLAGVIGWPIGHSLSPRLHGHWLARHRLPGFYIPIALAPDDFEGGLLSLPRLGFRGVNVTIPHKEKALALATEATERARKIGAANTLTFGADGSIHADNTDGFGFIENLRQSAPAWDAAAGAALVLGSGGSARAVILALLDAGAPEVRIANRNVARAEGVSAHFGGATRVIPWEAASESAADAATIVNTTPVGMTTDAIPIDLARAHRRALVADVVYGRIPTPFVAAARALGLEAVDGLGMLLHQGVPGFERWFGRRPDVDEELRRAVIGPA